MPLPLRSSYVFLLLALICFVVIMIVPAPAAATHGGRHIVTCGTGTSDPCTVCDFFALLQNILNFLWFSVSIPIAVLMMLYAGFLMILSATSEGASAGYSKGKKVLTTVLVGICIVFFAWLAIDTTIKLVGGKIIASSTDTRFGPWNKVICR